MISLKSPLMAETLGRSNARCSIQAIESYRVFSFLQNLKSAYDSNEIY